MRIVVGPPASIRPSLVMALPLMIATLPCSGICNRMGTIRAPSSSSSSSSFSSSYHLLMLTSPPPDIVVGDNAAAAAAIVVPPLSSNHNHRPFHLRQYVPPELLRCRLPR